MSRSTHDINLDHHGTLAIDRVAAGLAVVGSAFGQYYADQSILSILISLDARISAITSGYFILPGSFTMDAWVMPVFVADAVIVDTLGGSFASDSYFDPVSGAKTRTYLTADAEITT